MTLSFFFYFFFKFPSLKFPHLCVCLCVLVDLARQHAVSSRQEHLWTHIFWVRANSKVALSPYNCFNSCLHLNSYLVNGVLLVRQLKVERVRYSKWWLNGKQKSRWCKNVILPKELQDIPKTSRTLTNRNSRAIIQTKTTLLFQLHVAAVQQHPQHTPWP